MENTSTPVSNSVEQAEKPVTRNASWGAIISITIILAMVIIGAFYAWGQRVSEEHQVQSETSASI